MKASDSRSRFLPIAAGVLVALCVAWGSNALHLHALEKELDALAEERLTEFKADASVESVPSRMGAEVVASKPFVLWGAPTGKVSVFVEHQAESGSTAIEGYEFFFARNDVGEWVQTESGRCTSEQCTLDGKKLLDALGAKF